MPAVSDQRPWTCDWAPLRWRRPKRERAENVPRARAGPGLARSSREAPLGAHGAPSLTAAGERQPRGPQRRPRVVGHLSRPHQVPERLAQSLGGRVAGHQQVGEEARAALQAAADQLVLDPGGRLRGCAARWGSDRRGVLAEVQRHPAGAPERPRSDPGQLATGAQLVQPRGRVGAGAARDHVALPALQRQRESLQRHQHLAQAVDPGARSRAPVDALPGRQEGRQPALIGGLDLLAQSRERGPAQAPQDLHVAPLALAAAGAQLAAHQRSRALELAQHRAAVDAVALVQLRGRERAVGAGEAAPPAA